MIKIKCILFLIVCFFGFNYSINAQIVNIESKRFKTDTTGWEGSLNTRFNLEKNIQRIFSIGLGAHLQYKSKNTKNLYLFLTDFNFLRAKDEKFLNGGFAHLRYNYKVNKWLRMEAFFQTQYNRIIKLKHRELLGFGPRFKLSKFEDLRCYVGTLYMFEYEELVDNITIEKNHRLSSYVSLSMFPRDNVSISTTTYFQPKINDFSDFRISTDNKLGIGITSNFKLNILFHLGYDALPPVGIPKLTYAFQNGFEMEF
jgi:hypothetical protein